MKNYDLIYFMGDSFTFGYNQADDKNNEITVDNRFSNLVGKYYNLDVVNNASPGCGNQYIFQQVYKDVYKLINENKNFLAVIFFSSEDRIELYNKKNKYLQGINPNSFSFYKDFMIESWDQNYNREMTSIYILAIQTLLEKFNIDYVNGFVFYSPIKMPYCNTKKFIDECLVHIMGNKGCFQKQGHPNILGHQLIANKIINKVEELYGKN